MGELRVRVVAAFFFFFWRWWNKWQKNTTSVFDILLRVFIERSRGATWKEIRNIHHRVLTTQSLRSTGMRSDQFNEKQNATPITASNDGKTHTLMFYNLSPPHPPPRRKKTTPPKNPPTHSRWNQTNEKCWRQWQWTEVRAHSPSHTRCKLNVSHSLSLSHSLSSLWSDVCERGRQRARESVCGGWGETQPLCVRAEWAACSPSWLHNEGLCPKTPPPPLGTKQVHPTQGVEIKFVFTFKVLLKSRK